MTSSSHQAADEPAAGLATDRRDEGPLAAWASWWRQHWLAVLSHLAVIGIWSLASTRMPKFILPSPVDVLLVLINPRYNWPRHLLVTASEVFGGFALASV